MTWRDDLHRVTITVNGKQRNLVGASFRGVPFFVESSELGSGRRTVVHEFPFRDDPFVEDLGRKARTFRIDGYVLGDDYLTQRDALMTALDTEGPGTLVEPYYGTLRAIGSTVSIRQSSKEGGFAAFTIDFQETPAQAPVPTAVVDAAGQVSDSADAAAGASDAEFASQYNESNLPGFALQSAQDAITKAAAAMRGELGPVIAATQELASLNAQVTVLTATASSLVRTPALIMGQFRTAITTLVTTALNAPEALMNALTSAYSVDLGTPVVATTVTRAQELANQLAITAGLRRVFAVEAARLAPTVPYTSTDDALAARDQIAGILDAEAELAGDAAYGALVDLRSQVLQAVPGSSEFANIVTITRRVPVPSLVLAYQLYGAVDLEPDILARNDIQNPGFCVGDLKVLSDDA